MQIVGFLMRRLISERWPHICVEICFQDEDVRYDEITKWLSEMEAPDEFMMKFVQQNDINVNGM